MGSEVSPNQLRLARDTFVELTKLGMTVSHPLRNVTGRYRFIARGMLSLLLLGLISSGLRMDFRALMTLSGITREGKFEAGKRVHDPDQKKRRKLRDITVSLKASQLLKTEQVHYVDLKSVQAPSRLLGHIPEEGIICWAGAVLYVKRRPSGPRTSVFGFDIPNIKIINWKEPKAELPAAERTTIEFCTQEVRSVCSSLMDLLEKNRIQEKEVFEQLQRFNEIKSDSLETGLITYFVSSFEEPRGFNGRMFAVLPFFGLEKNNRL